MEPRRGQRRARQAGSPRRVPAPYAAGEDVSAPVRPRVATAAKARPRRDPAPRAPRATPARVRQTPLAEPLAPVEPRRQRWRRPSRRRVALVWLGQRASVGAHAAGRQLRRISPGRAFSIFAPLGLLLALVAWVAISPYWQTRRVRIQGTSDPTLLALAHAQRLTGCNAFRCDFSAAQRAIGASPRVQSVSIQVVFPDTTLVRVTPRQAAALWRTQGQTWAVGADGVVVGSIQVDPALAGQGAALVDDPGDLAFAGQTPRPGVRMDAALVTMARQLRISAPAVGLDPQSISYSAADGFTLRASGSGALVVFGAPADAQATLAELTSVSPIPASPATTVTPAQAAQGAKLQAEAAGVILSRLAQSGASATRIDVRWGSHPYYR